MAKAGVQIRTPFAYGRHVRGLSKNGGIQIVSIAFSTLLLCHKTEINLSFS
jgi:hypothetical protein